MASFLSSLSRLAKSPQGKKALAEAQKFAKDPATRKKLQDVGRQVTAAYTKKK